MKGIIDAFSTIINIFKMIFSIIMDTFSVLASVFNYLIQIVNITFNTLLTLPDWLKGFAVITISISIAYFLIGRTAGKSGD